ncbi:MAG: hypothetical protein LC637_04750 [Xanthomonadaceae bacterium]|nr:hypothetical protein [Xanthomonadaceae bacterium]
MLNWIVQDEFPAARHFERATAPVARCQAHSGKTGARHSAIGYDRAEAAASARRGLKWGPNGEFVQF